MNLIAEITASDFAGYQAVLAIHAEGSIEAGEDDHLARARNRSQPSTTRNASRASNNRRAPDEPDPGARRHLAERRY